MQPSEYPSNPAVSQPFRLFTDVSGEPFWTIVADTEVDSLDDFFEMEAKVAEM